MSLEILSKAVQESYFQDLLNTYSFREVCRFSNEIDDRHEEYILGFESSNCKMKVYYQSGGSISLSIGTSNHDFALDSKDLSWVDFQQLLAYIQKKSWEFHFSKHILLIDTFKEFLNNAVNDFRKHDELIFTMFSSQEVFESWFPKMREYIELDLKRRYRGI